MTHIGQYGGQYVPETALGGARIFLKREDLNHTGAHKVNNVLGQALLARRMGKTRLIAETGAGMHGVATATAAALLGLPCVVYMGALDVARQAPNVDRMRALGAEVIAVQSGSRTLKDAMNEAIRDWAASAEHTFYVIGTVAGPAIGREARRQCLDKLGRLPDEVIACVGGGSNAMGIFAGFLDDSEVRLTGVEAAGEGLATGRHAASINGGTVGVLHGAKTKLLQTPEGQILEAYSVSAGLDYPGVGPEHCHLADLGRARYAVCDDRHAIHAFDALCRCEGIIPALESSHALAEAIRIAPTLPREAVLVVNLSGRGDKDMDNVTQWKAAHPDYRYEGPHSPDGGTLQGSGPQPSAEEARASSSAHRSPAGGARLKAAFAHAKAEGRAARVLYMPCGFPSMAETEAAMEALIAGGADVLELGVPFSDPIADGPVIQAAGQQALAGGVNLPKILDLAACLRAKHPETGLVLFSYYNPILAYGPERLCADAAAAGVDGLLVVDVPHEEEAELRPIAEAAGLSWIPLVSPATTPERAKELVAGCDGFVYVITVCGITGERKALPPELTDRLEALRRVTDLPLAAGFGISDHATAEAIAAHADGYVVGSAAVRALAEGGIPGLNAFLTALRGA